MRGVKVADKKKEIKHHMKAQSITLQLRRLVVALFSFGCCSNQCQQMRKLYCKENGV